MPLDTSAPSAPAAITAPVAFAAVLDREIDRRVSMMQATGTDDATAEPRLDERNEREVKL